MLYYNKNDNASCTGLVIYLASFVPVAGRTEIYLYHNVIGKEYNRLI